MHIIAYRPIYSHNKMHVVHLRCVQCAIYARGHRIKIICLRNLGYPSHLQDSVFSDLRFALYWSWYGFVGVSLNNKKLDPSYRAGEKSDFPCRPCTIHKNIIQLVRYLTLIVVQLTDPRISFRTKYSTKYFRLGSRLSAESSVNVYFILELVIREVIRKW